MGMPVITPTTITNCEAIQHLVESIALEETALAAILDGEGRKLQKLIAQATTTDQLLAVNASVQGLVDAISKLEMVLQTKLALFQDCICETP